jgi:tetratricopeptide (TPR) repeat protein
MELLQMAEQQSALPRREELVIAIHSGLTVAEETIHGVKVTGETMQTLRRLAAVVEPGVVVVTESVHKSSRIYFEQESLGTITVRGVAEPLSLHRVIKQAPVTLNRVELVDPGNLTPLIGRDTEFSILKDRWDQAIEALGQIVLLIGEAGLGKSRLIREIREHVIRDGLNPDIIELRCSQYHQSTGLYPMVEHLSQLLQWEQNSSTDSRVAAIQRYLESLNLCGDRNTALLANLMGVDASQLPALDVSPQKKREMTAAFLLELLRRRSELRPVLFIVEDLHWVDPTLLELLAAYVDGFDQHRSLSIFTFRPEFETPWKSKPHQTQIALNRLTKRQIRDMMRKRLGRDTVPDLLVEQIAQRTDGIPLFIEEFSTLLAETGSLDEGSISESAINQVIPASLQDLLMARLDRMASDPEVIQLAAAIGREFSYALLSAASELKADQLQTELEKLVSAEVLFRKGEFPDASFIFKHALIQDSAYNSLLKKRRQGIHARIGAALETRFPEIVSHQPELVAHHFTEADIAAKGAEYWLKAGVKAQAISANVEAISHLTYGLKVLQSIPESSARDQLELGFQLTLAPVLMAARGWSATEVGTAIERARQLVANFGSLEEKFFVMWGLWGWRVIRADMDIAGPIAEDMMKLAQSSPEGAELLAEAYWCVGCTHYYRGDFQSGLELLEKGLSLIDDDQERNHALKTGQRCSLMCRSHIALALWGLGYPDQAMQRTDENLRLGRQHNHPFTFAMSHFFRRQILDFCGFHDLSRASIEDEYRICHDNGFVFFEVHAHFGRGTFALREGRIDEARRQFDVGLEMLKATGGHLSMDHAYHNIAEAYLGAGRLDDAKEWLDRGFDLVNNRNQRRREVEFLRLQGVLALAAGDQTGAEASYRKAIDVARRQQARSWELRATINLAELKKLQGQASEGRQILEAVYGFFTEGFGTADLVRAKALLNELGASS